MICRLPWRIGQPDHAWPASQHTSPMLTSRSSFPLHFCSVSQRLCHPAAHPARPPRGHQAVATAVTQGLPARSLQAVHNRTSRRHHSRPRRRRGKGPGGPTKNYRSQAHSRRRGGQAGTWRRETTTRCERERRRGEDTRHKQQARREGQGLGWRRPRSATKTNEPSRAAAPHQRGDYEALAG